MKLLDKRKIDTEKATERQREVDEGLKLAESVDKLRRAKLDEEKSLREWREANLKSVQIEIDKQLEEKGTLQKENEDAREERKKLLAPLDEEWAKVSREKKIMDDERFTLQIQKEISAKEKKEIAKEKELISQLVVKSKENEETTAKTKTNAISLKEMAQREYEIARTEREQAEIQHEHQIAKTAELEKEYEIALKTIDIREKEVREKDKDLLLREQDLARQIRNFQTAREVIKI